MGFCVQRKVVFIGSLQRVVEDADPYRACAWTQEDAQCAPLQSVFKAGA